MGRHVIFLCPLLVILGLLAGIACAAEEPELVATAEPTASPSIIETDTAPVQTPESTAIPGAQVFNVGDTVRLGDLHVTVNGVRASLGDNLWTPDRGNYFVYVDVTFRNEGDQPEIVSTLLQMEMRNTEGRSYNIDFSAISGSGSSPPDGEISPGDILRGEVGYQLPVDVGELTWRFSGDILRLGQAIFSLGTVAVPESPLEGALVATAEPIMPTSAVATTSVPTPTFPPPRTYTPRPTTHPTVTLEPTATPEVGFGPGTYRVGSDIQPGIYVGKAGSNVLDSCYWARLSGVSGEISDVTANDNANGQFYVEVLDTDKYLEIGCQIVPLDSWPIPEGSLSEMGPGTYMVGRDVTPGIYRGEAGTEVGDSCYWARLSGVSGEISDVTANDIANGQFYVEVMDTDQYLKISCHIVPLDAWPIPDAPLSEMGPGTYLVGRDVTPGIYRGEAGTEIGDSCYWARLSGVSGEISDVIANDIANGVFFVDVHSSDYAFSTGCPLEISE